MILPIFVFSRSRNSMVPLSKLYHHWLTSKIQFEPEILELWGYPSFSLVEFHHSTCIYVSRSRNSIVTLSELYHHRLTSKIQYEPEVLELWGYSSFSTVEFYDITYVYVFEFEEFNSDTFRTIAPTIFLKKSVRTGSTGTLRLPIFLPGGILWFYLYLCFRGRRTQWTHFHIHIIIAWFRKSSSNRKYWNFKVAHISRTWFLRSTGGGRILKVSLLNSSTLKT